MTTTRKSIESTAIATEKSIETFFTFPPIGSKLITLVESDSNHYPESDSDLVLWMPEYRDLDYKGHGEKWVSQSGTKPRNIEPAQYAKNAEIYRHSFEFRAWSICTPSQIVGNNHVSSDEGRVYLDRLYESEAIRKIGVIENTGGYNEYRLTPAGIDLLFGVNSLVNAKMIHPLNDNCEPVEIAAGAVYMACNSLGLSRSYPNTAYAGSLIPEACLNGGVDSLLSGGRVVKAGSLADQFSNVALLPKIADYFRAVAVIEADCRIRGGKTTDEQEAYLTKLFNVAIGAQE